MMELLSPAGGWEAMVAAVQNGADAVYMGFGGLNARRSARNFTDEEFREAVAYCHLRRVKVYLTLNKNGRLSVTSLFTSLMTKQANLKT